MHLQWFYRVEMAALKWGFLSSASARCLTVREGCLRFKPSVSRQLKSFLVSVDVSLNNNFYLNIQISIKPFLDQF